MEKSKNKNENNEDKNVPVNPQSGKNGNVFLIFYSCDIDVSYVFV